MRRSLLGWLLAAVLLQASPCAAQTASATVEIAQASKGRSPTAATAGEQSRSAQVNNWTVGVAGGFFEGTFIRFAVELAKALDDGENLRILPIVSYGGNENINDLLYLKGVDVAITYTDTFELYRKLGRVKNIEQRVNYISELLVGELYIFARPEIKTLKDLEGKKVSLGTKGGSATTTGPIVFERLGIQPDLIYVNNTIALEKMKAGEIDAIVSTGGKPNDLFVKFKPEPGFHFLAVEYSPKFADYYLPCPLSHDDYPHLIAEGQKVETLCMSAVLAVYNFPKGSDQARRLERFIQYYFERFDKLKQPSFHPKWKDVNLAAKVPGWSRYWLAAEKVDAMAKASSVSGTEGAKRSPAESAANRDPPEQDELFKQFLVWDKQRGKKQ
jgi:ABC-type amino acid transport substrate-binding protein